MDILKVLKQVALSVLARRKKWVLVAFFAALGLFVPVAYRMSHEPPRFRTSATILMETRPEGVALFREFAPFRPLEVQLAILKSRGLSEAVVESLPRNSVEDLVQNPYTVDYMIMIQNWLRRLRGEEIVVESPQRRALNELRLSRLQFRPIGTTGIVEVSAEASQPRVAMDIANTFVEVLVSRTRSFNVEDSKTSREFLEQQQNQIGKQLTVAEEAMRQFTNARGGVRVPARHAEAVTRLGQMENTYAEVVANKAMAQNRLTALKTKVESMPASSVALARPTSAAAPAAPRIQRLRTKLQTLEAQLLEFQIQYTDEHPRVMATKRQISDVQKELGDAVKETTPVPTAGSSVPASDRSAFAETMAALETSTLSLNAQEEALREQINNQKKNLTGLSRDELEYTRLATDVESNRRLHAMLSEKLSAARIREQGEMKVVKIIDAPSVPLPTSNQKRVRFFGVALALALVIGLGVPATIEYFNRPVETDDDIRSLTGLPVLTSIPRVRSRRSMFMIGGGQPDDVSQEEYFLFVEAFRRLRVEIQLLGRDIPMRRIMIASALPGEGKSTVVVNLGLVFGEVGKHVIIADADFHRPTLHRTLKTPNAKGFSDLLAGTGELREAMSPVAEGVWLTPRGASSTALTRTGLGSARLPEVLDSMSVEVEYVLLDSSPILLIPDNLYMAAATDGVILVCQSGITRPRDFLRAKSILEKSGTPILGVVLNQVPVRKVNQYYSYYRAYAKADTRA
jgi:capsular exopolysaccharide synthesis family protein